HARRSAQLRGRIGALVVHARGHTNTGPARAAFHTKFEREVDPEGILAPEERARRADYARRAHMSRLALASAVARQRRARASPPTAPPSPTTPSTS
ncbi:MAG: hypothetical protein OEV36_12635, partial [Myxococcales bacterium]|nr:hypothetical protein [Myxococcales bacterium]